MEMGNLFTDAAPPAEGERFDTLLRHGNLVVERIVSASEITPREYVQQQDEWVVLLQGEAQLDVDGRHVALASGDYLFLPAGTPHTVKRTSQGALWMAVHLYGESPQREGGNGA